MRSKSGMLQMPAFRDRMTPRFFWGGSLSSQTYMRPLGRGRALGKAAMKRYRQSAKGQAAGAGPPEKSGYNESPKGRATLQALRERNKEHQKAYRESPRAGCGLRSRMGE